MMKDFAMISKFGRAAVAMPLMVLLMSGTAQAALTADQVWQSWKDAAALAGLTVSAATEAKDGGSLMLNGVTVAGAEGEGLTISDMLLAEQADGSVLITPGADIGIDYGGANGDTSTLDVVHDGLTITAREDGEALIYDYAATSVSANFNSSYATLGTEGDAAAPKATTLAKVMFEGLAGTYSDTPGANRAFGMDLTATKLAYDVTSDFPDLPMKTTSVSETADVAIDFDMTMPQTVSLMALQSASEFQKALQEGFAFTATTKQGLSSGKSSQESAFMPYAMEMIAQPGEASFAFDKDLFSVQSSGAGLEVNFSSATLPAPVKVTSGPVQMNMMSPVTVGDTAGDYALLMKISQLTVNDEAWAMLDPGGALKRDPADLSIDVSGKGKIDFLGMATAEETGAVPPVPSPESLDIKDLSLKVAGAAFAATGAFTFDNSAGVPVPLGEANVSLTGGNALIDGLIATGMVTEEDAMGARMMMGMFFTPGADADSLTTKIEAKAGNEIYVNGNRIQ
jgi:Uncharacterized protein conserved in bacteria (DUF2125)